MKNLILEMANNEVEENEGFVVDNDTKADWCLDKIREEEAEIKRFEMVMEQKIHEMKKNFENFRSSKDSSIEFFKCKLFNYMETLEIKATKAGNKTYKLPSGVLKIKKQQKKIEKDEAELLKFVKSTDLEFVKISETVNWGEMKKILTQTETGYITSDGEIVKGITLVDRPDKFEVEV